MKWCRKSGGISVNKGQVPCTGLRQTLVMSDHSNGTASRTVRHYFGTSLSKTPWQSCIHKCHLKLKCVIKKNKKKMKPYVNLVQNQHWHSLVWRHLGSHSGYVYFCHTKKYPMPFLEEICFRPKGNGPSRQLSATGPKARVSDSVASVPLAKVISTSVMPALMHRSAYYGPTYSTIFSLHFCPCIFQQDNAKPHSPRFTNAQLRKKKVWVPEWHVWWRCGFVMQKNVMKIEWDKKNTMWSWEMQKCMHINKSNYLWFIPSAKK